MTKAPSISALQQKNRAAGAKIAPDERQCENIVALRPVPL
jgi:hypothetical protein